ncbi:MAG: hypothetical protein J6Y81_17350 [Ruminococcus sp.]|nr:hypothetical protein [Ruminococcus sp.]
MFFSDWTSRFFGAIIKPYQTKGAVKMDNRISYVLGMLRSIVRGTDRMCSTGRC